MSVIPSNVDYTDKDFDSIRDRLESLMSAAWSDWTDFSTPSKMDVLLMEANAFVIDVGLYYLDKLARESRILSATERRNVIELCRLINYSLSGASAATVDVDLTLDSVPIADVTLNAGDVVRTKDVTSPVRFQLLSDATIPAGTSPPTVVATVENSETRLASAYTDGRNDFEMVLESTPYLDDSAEVTAPNGTYTQVSSFLESTATDRHFVVRVNQNDRATLIFGDGTNGQPPSKGTISVDYKTGGGVEGNVDVGTIKVVESSYTDDEGRPVRVSVNNAAAASGGSDRETVQSARVNAPASTRALTRSVTNDDFETHARISGVSRTLCLTSDEDTTIPENTAYIFVVPTGGGTPSSALLAEVLNEVTVEYPQTITLQVEARAPTYLEVDVEVRVTFSDGVTPTEVRDDIIEALTDLFALEDDEGAINELIGFGADIDGYVAWSDVLNAVRDTTGVRKVGPSDLKLNELVADAAVGLFEFPTLGDVEVIDASTGLAV